MNKIQNNILEQELKFDGEIILKYKIEFPQIVDSRFYYGKEIFNMYNKTKAKKLKDYCQTELFEQAKETYRYNKENNYPIMVYEVIQNYTITYNNQNIVSLYSDEYQFTGGVHGNTIRNSQNWNLELAKQIPLQNFFPNNQNYILTILNKINSQIKAQIESGEKQYFDNYCELVVQNLNTENFVLYPTYIEVYFQQYEIAPYSSGIPTFKI